MFIIGLGMLAITLSMSIPLSFMFKEVWQRVLGIIIITPLIFYGAILLITIIARQ
jgi:hypothetical protein